VAFLPPGAFHGVTEGVDSAGADGLAFLWLVFSGGAELMGEEVVDVAELSVFGLENRAGLGLEEEGIVIVELTGGEGGSRQD